jgi:aminoglycoside phosphotransferase (APT) family kinase protein
VSALLGMPAAVVVQDVMRGPKTIVHGDAKVANFAIDPRTQAVSAFDWAMAGHAPAGVDVGWYLLVNGSRIAESKEAALARYRARLTEERGTISESAWIDIERCAVMCGASMGLWSKAMLLESGVPNADREWEWWIERLVALT